MLLSQPEEDVIRGSRRKRKGKREEDLKDLPIKVTPHILSDEKLRDSLAQAAGNSSRMKATKESMFSRPCIQLKSNMWLSMLAEILFLKDKEKFYDINKDK